MKAEDKQLKVVSVQDTANDGVPKKRLLLYVSCSIIILVIIVLVVVVALNGRSSPSDKLTGKITHLEQKSYCDQGLKQIGPDASTLEATQKYTNAARENALDYLMKCSFVQGHTVQALSYSNVLDELYVQDRNTQKQQALAQFVTYMKDYGH